MDSAYITELARAMELVASQPRSVFLCQSLYAGNVINRTCEKVPSSSWIELPVFEDVQMGMAIGLSLSGWLPITIYPRCEFLLLAVNQLVNHLDRLPDFSDYRPKVLVRVLIGHSLPLDSGPQMTNDYMPAISAMLKRVRVEYLETADSIYPAYQRAVNNEGSTILVEYSRLFFSI